MLLFYGRIFFTLIFGNRVVTAGLAYVTAHGVARIALPRADAKCIFIGSSAFWLGSEEEKKYNILLNQ